MALTADQKAELLAVAEAMVGFRQLQILGFESNPTTISQLSV